jgi:hypothetical protein
MPPLEKRVRWRQLLGVPFRKPRFVPNIHIYDVLTGCHRGKWAIYIQLHVHGEGTHPKTIAMLRLGPLLSWGCHTARRRGRSFF